MLGNMLQQCGHIESSLVVDGAGVVLHRHHPCTCFSKQLARNTAHVAKTLYGNAGALDLKTDVLRGLTAYRVHPAPSGFTPAQRAAQINGFACHHACGGRASIHGVGVHHPRHDLLVGVHIRRGNVFVWPDDDANLAGVAAGHALQLAH